VVPADYSLKAICSPHRNNLRIERESVQRASGITAFYNRLGIERVRLTASVSSSRRPFGWYPGSPNEDATLKRAATKPTRQGANLDLGAIEMNGKLR
jgi:hypothetical protein